MKSSPIRHILAVVLALTMLLTAAAPAFAADPLLQSGDFSYTVKDCEATPVDYTGTNAVVTVPVLAADPPLQSGDFSYTVKNCEATLAGYTGTDAVVTVPDTLGGYPVVAIGQAFNKNTNVTEVTLPDTVTTIVGNSFSGCTNLRKVNFPDKLKSIGTNSFSACQYLRDVVLPDSLITIGDSAFSSCTSLTDIVIPDSVVSIAKNAFAYCSGLMTVYMGDGVTLVDEYAFNECKALTKLTIGKNVRIINRNAFANCTSLTAANIPNQVRFVGESAFGGCSKISSIIIGNHVARIGKSAFKDTAFYKNENNWENGLLYADDWLVSSSNIPGGVKSINVKPGTVGIAIGVDAWTSSGIQSVTLPSSLRHIESDSFSYTEAREGDGSGSVYLDGWLLKVTEAASGELQIRNGTVGIANGACSTAYNFTSVRVPDSVKYIGYAAFSGASKLESVILPQGITDIENNTFYSCQKLISVSIPGTVSYIGDSAFSLCYKLDTVFIPSGVKFIGNNTFSSCRTFTEILLPDTVTYIGTNAFSNCTGLTSINIPAGVTHIDPNAFAYCTALKTLYITDLAAWCRLSFYDLEGSPQRYATTLYLNGEFLREMNIPEGVTEIHDWAFYGLTNINYITFPQSVTKIGKYAFYSCEGLQSITLPDSVKDIGDYAFAYCKGLYSVQLPAGLKKISNYMFDNCTSLYMMGEHFDNELAIPEGITEIGENGLHNIMKNSFYNTVSLPLSLKHIGNYGLTTWATISSVYYPGTMAQWNAITIDGNNPLKNATVYDEALSIPRTTIKLVSSQPVQVKVTRGIRTLREGTDYTAAATPGNGTVTVTVTGKGLYSGKQTQTFSLGTQSIASASVSSLVSKPYTGKAITQSFTVTLGGKTLREGTDYTVSYQNNVNPGTATVTITGKGGYSGTLTKYFTITSSTPQTKLATPELSSVTNASKGVTVKWGAVNGAAKYRVLYKTSGGSWTKAGDTTSTSYTVTGLSSGTKYSFTVRCLSSDGKSYTSDYNTTGKSITYIAQPSVSSVANASSGVTVKWSAVKGAAKYRVLYKTSSGSWTKAGDTTSTSYTVTGLSSGTKYSFTVRCLSSDGKSYTSSYSTTGKSITYIARPSVSSVANASSGVTVKWSAVKGAAKYRVLYKTSGGSWTKAGDTTSTSYTVKGLSSGTKYSFTVRCLSSDGNSYTSSYSTTGKSITYIARPAISSLANTSSGITVKWSKVKGADGYQIYRNGKKIATVKSGSTVSYTDKVATTNGEKYQYKIVAISMADGKVVGTSTASATKTIYRLSVPSNVTAKNSTSKAIKVSWSKNSKATGYQIKYTVGSTSKTVKVTKAATVSKTISKLTKGKTYKVSVRAYKTVGDYTYYSAYSSAKSVKVAK